MSHPQAFHTSCREGLGGISGFQINAASPALDREQLAGLSEAHARYDTPHDLPYEPTAEQMRRFPVALRTSVVPAVGPVVSRTEYVGREYRGSDGRPDEGRFGNYFCHMVVGEAGDDPFDGLTAVELWDAPHWTTAEVTGHTLPPLGELTPGPLNLADVLQVVTTAPQGVAGALVDGALRALDGGPPVLIVDPEANRAVTWLAWITFSLPPDAARALTFSSFEGRPQDVLNLHVIATTPACDGGPTMTSRVTRIDVTSPTTTGSPSLYARGVLALAEQDSEALASAVRRVRGQTGPERGASLAVEGKVAELVQEDELSPLLDQLRSLVSGGRVADAAASVAALRSFPQGDLLALREWLALYVQARRSTAGDAARDLASAALARLIPHLAELPDNLPPIPADAPAAPRVSGIGAWLRATEAARGTDDSGRMVKHGLELGLLGLNVPVDTRLTAVIVEDLERPTMRVALDAIDADGRSDHIIEQVTSAVACEPWADRRSHARLLALSRYEMAQQTLRRRARDLGTFEAITTWQRVRVALNPAARVEAARALATIAGDVDASAAIRELWGEHGPQAEREIDELLRAYLDLGRPVPRKDIEVAFRLLMRSPLSADPPSTSVGYTLARLPASECDRPEFDAWWSAGNPPGRGRGVPLSHWSERAVAALGAQASEIPDDRWHELLDAVAGTLIRARRDAGFAEILGRFRQSEFGQLCEAMGSALAREVEASPEPAVFIAQEFDRWMRISRELADDLLPTAFQRVSGHDIEEAAQLVSPAYAAEWADWTQRNPRTGARAVVERVFGRRGKARDAADR